MVCHGIREDDSVHVSFIMCYESTLILPHRLHYPIVYSTLHGAVGWNLVESTVHLPVWNCLIEFTILNGNEQR